LLIIPWPHHPHKKEEEEEEEEERTNSCETASNKASSRGLFFYTELLRRS
jgi:hypothetical protein